MRYLIHLLMSLCVLAGLVSCSQGKTPEPTALPIPVFEKAACPFKLPPSQVAGQTVECGYLRLPENRSEPGAGSAPARTIQLAVAIFHPAGGATQPDPIVYLMGGPGASALKFLYLSFDLIYAPVLAAGRDLIFFDQRGVGLSQPALDCPQAADLGLELLDNELDGKPVSDDEARSLLREAFQSCAQDLQAVADLSAYNSLSSAADVNDLRLALGYEQINLWGASYGTRLALEILRDYPEIVRSAVLDSVYPPDVDLSLGSPANLERALTILFQACASDPACNAAYPDLRTVFFDTLKHLEAEPVSTRVTDPLANQTYSMQINDDALFGLIFQLLYENEAMPALPQLIYEAKAGNFSTITRISGALIAQRNVSSRGMFFSVQCNEELTFSSLEQYEAVLTGYPDLAPYMKDSILGNLGYDVCSFWGAGQAAPAENQPVSSAIPTLVMQGEFDPITPPEWGQRTAETLENSHFYLFPSVGHGVMATECGREMVTAFFRDPQKAPEDSCINGIGKIAFSLPEGTPLPVEMVAFSSPAKGIQGIAPQDWKAAAQGTYTRSRTSLDETALIMDTAPITAHELLNHLAEDLAFDPGIESTSSQELGVFTWTFYTFEYQGLVLDLALAEGSGQAYLVLLASSPNDHQNLYDQVFMPAVEALAPIR
jgi:pimeloyl-ACP methyl ester carboxylesterase